MNGVALRGEIPLAMLMEPHILLYGREATLLETRSWILAKAGFQVARAMTLAEVKRALATYRPEVFVLCHTLSAEECAEGEMVARQDRPAMKMAVLPTGLFGGGEPAHDSILSIPGDPLSLITTVRRMTSGDGSQPN